MGMLPGDQLDAARRAIDERAEPADLGTAQHLDEPLDHAPVEVTDDLGVDLGQAGERAMRKGDGDTGVVGGQGRVVAEVVELGHESGDASGGRVTSIWATGIWATGIWVTRIWVTRIRVGQHGGRHHLGGLSPLGPTDLRGLLRTGTGSRRHLDEETGQEGRGRWLEPEPGRVGGERVAMVGPADSTAGLGLHLQETHVSHALEVGSHRVRVELERLGDLSRGARAR